jgi:hypothetical protein
MGAGLCAWGSWPLLVVVLRCRAGKEDREAAREGVAVGPRAPPAEGGPAPPRAPRAPRAAAAAGGGARARRGGGRRGSGGEGSEGGFSCGSSSSSEEEEPPGGWRGDSSGSEVNSGDEEGGEEYAGNRCGQGRRGEEGGHAHSRAALRAVQGGCAERRCCANAAPYAPRRRAPSPWPAAGRA